MDTSTRQKTIIFHRSLWSFTMTENIWFIYLTCWGKCYLTLAIGRFNKAGLLEWMHFVIFCAKVARGRSALPSQFLSRCCFTLCITVELEPRIAKQYKCQYSWSCKYYCGKGLEGGKKSVFASFWGWPEEREFLEKMHFGASCSTSNN